MIRRGTRARAGITLTEILISILIMGVGLVSLATLFPLGLLRLRNAARMSRSALVTATATGETASRNLFNRSSFIYDPGFASYDPLLYRTCPWYVAPLPFDYNAAFDPLTYSLYDPWIQDTPAYRQTWTNGVYSGRGGIGTGLSPNTQVTVVGGVEINRLDGPGLMVAYDPLWRAVANVFPDGTDPEARFACGTDGTDPLRNDPNPGPGSSLPSAHGLQRITNFSRNAINNQVRVPNIFVSPDDVVFQSSDFLTLNNPNGDRSAGSASPVVPDMSNGTVNDWRFTWMFTGRRNDAGDATVYSGDVVVFDSRPFAVNGTDVAGERVVEAVFGYSRSVVTGEAGIRGYGAGADRTVLLRWRATEPDPEIRVGGWIADVTYERNRAESNGRSQSADTELLGNSAAAVAFRRQPEALGSREYQRCHWYQVVKKSPAVDGPPFGDTTTAWRSLNVIVNRPLQAKTLLVKATGNPYHVNAALVSPYVVNVFPKSFTAR